MMAQNFSGQWPGTVGDGFNTLVGVTTRYFDAFERLSALNLQAIRFGLAESQETLAHLCAAKSLPEMLSLPTLLAPAEFAQTLSYNRQFFEIVSDLQRGCALQAPLDAAGERRQADNLAGGLAARSRVPCDVPATPQTSATSAGAHASPATTTTEREIGQAEKPAILPMRTE
ncbi:TIGR01841 family phasin [Paraburkholderia strydomiana]|jgi:phasin family protein|uniref:TIGR01841 family phasin n=2 Tax=Paraburkholderia strydomiana TaxID=1245417 RepID=A0ABW9ELX1_9BURK